MKRWLAGMAGCALSCVCVFVEVGSTAEHPAVSAERKIPAGPLGETIRLGEEIVAHTQSHALSRQYVGNALNCTSCHLQNGTDPQAASFIGVATAYPAWSPRERRVITLEDRILNCFMRSCDGVRPPLGSEVSVAIAAYITWLSSNQPLRMNGQRPAGPLAIPRIAIADSHGDALQGARLYAKRCASCHGDDGQGNQENPPLWGKRSFNDGAGLANDSQLASWLKVAMPLAEADLSEREALDLATFVNQHERPRFRLADHLPKKEALGTYNGSNDSDAGR